MTTCVRDNIAFAPQYPLWSDGTSKRRWIYLPPGTAIDASRVDAWEFPVGTRLWKEFGYDRRVETRFIERLADGSWRFAAYVWNEEGTDAVLAAEDGAVLPVSAAPGGRYVVPSRNDCLACHEGPPVPVLGFSALQLSPDRDPLAPHAEPARKITRICRTSSRADGCATCRAVTLNSRRALQPVAHRARRARLSARQLRSLPQRCRRADGTRARARAAGRRTPRKAPNERCSHCSAIRAASVRKAPTAHSASRATAARMC